MSQVPGGHRRRTPAFVAMTLALAAATTFAGCSSSGQGAPSASQTAASAVPSASTSTAEPVTLTVQQQTGSEALFSFLAKEFQAKYPNVTVKLQTISQEQKVGSNLAVLGSSNPPDIGMIPINSQVYTQLVANKALTPIDDVWTAGNLRQRYSKSVADSLLVGGSPYTVAYTQVIYDVVWYNPDLFAKAGITVPDDHRIASVSDLVAMTNKLKAIGAGPLQIGGGSGYHASWMIDALLHTSASPEQMQNYLTSYDKSVTVTAKYTDSAFTDVLTTLSGLNSAGVFQTGFLGQQAPDALAPFLAGKAGMALGGNFTTADFAKEKPAFTPGWLLLPPVKPGAKTVQTLYFGDAYGIPAGATNQEWAKKFLEFVMSDDMQQRAIIDTAGLLPSVNSLSPDALAKLDDVTKELMGDIAANGAAPGWTSTVPGGFGQQFIDPLLQQMYGGEISVQDVAQKQQDKLDEIRSK